MRGIHLPLAELFFFHFPLLVLKLESMTGQFVLLSRGLNQLEATSYILAGFQRDVPYPKRCLGLAEKGGELLFMRGLRIPFEGP